MIFEQALEAMRGGKSVRRPDWQHLTCLLMRGGKIYSVVAGREFYCGQFAQALILAEDWEVAA